MVGDEAVSGIILKEEYMAGTPKISRWCNEDETWFALYVDGKLYSLKQESFPSGKSPLIVAKDGENWTLSFQGLLNEEDKVTFSAKFNSKHSPIDFTSNMPPERMAGAIANEKWSKEFFNELQNVSGQCHYEQEGIKICKNISEFAKLAV